MRSLMSAAIVLAACAVFFAPTAEARRAKSPPPPAPEIPLVPLAAAKGYSVEGRKNIFDMGGVRAVVEEILPSEEAAYFEARAGRSVRIFTSEGSPEPPRILSLTLSNRSEKQLMFQPGFVTIEGKDIGGIKPMEYASLYMLLSPAPPGGLRVDELQWFLEKFVWSQPETIPPGGVVSRLLVFPALPPKLRTFVVDCAWLYLGDANLHLTFTYEAPPPTKKGRGR